MAKVNRPMVLVLLAMALITGCAQDRQYRSTISEEPLVCRDQCGDGTASLEQHHYQTADAKASGDYLLGFVEFDDQGWFFNATAHPTQRDVLLRHLKKQATDAKQHFLIVAYVHGWFHNARPDDENVLAFQSLLERLDQMEQLAKPAAERRTIVGVYLGWRGETLEIFGLKHALTFWSRMGAAERVGEGALKQMLMELDQFKCYANRASDHTGNHLCDDVLNGPDQTQLVVIGHSFGGLAVHHALRTELIERTTRLWRTGAGTYPYSVARGFGDLVLLVNPAFEGSSFEPVWRAAQSRCYSASQRPVMMIATSKSDLATGIAFPLGRLYTLTESADQDGERLAVMGAVGHLDRYRTHDLHYQEPSFRTAPDDPTKVTPASQMQSTAFIQAASPPPPQMERRPVLSGTTLESKYGNATLERWSNEKRRDGGYEAVVEGNPFIVASADSSIIAGHSDIWNDRFVDFMRTFLVTELGKPKSPVNPSCDWPN